MLLSGINLEPLRGRSRPNDFWVLIALAPPPSEICSDLNGDLTTSLEEAIAYANAAESEQNFKLAVAQWYRFHHRFAGASPLEAHRKNGEHLPDVTRWTDAMKRVSDPNLGLDQLVGVHEQIGNPFLNQTKREELRFIAIRESMHGMIQNRRADEFVVIFVGAAQAYDYYAKYPDTGAISISQPFNSQSQLSQDRLVASLNRNISLEYPHLWKRPSQAKLIAGISNEAHAIHLGYLVDGAFNNRGTETRITPPQPPYLHTRKTAPNLPSAAIFMDTHGLECTTPMECLPTTKALRSLGIRSITVGLEGFSRGPIEPEIASQRLDFASVEFVKALRGRLISMQDGLSRHLKENGPKTGDPRFIEMHNQIADALKNLDGLGPFSAFPNYRAFLDRIIAWQREWIKVNVVGIDTPEGSLPMATPHEDSKRGEKR